jgi:hypothetical protein
MFESTYWFIYHWPISQEYVCCRNIVSRACSDYRRGLDWQYDLLNALTHNFTNRCHTEIGVLTLLQFPLCSRCLISVSNRGCSPSCGFPNCLRVSPKRLSQQQLITTEPLAHSLPNRLTQAYLTVLLITFR